MDIKLDDRRIKEIVYQLEDGRVVRYNFKDGEINYIQLVNESVIKECKEMPTDSEMIERIRRSEFMGELEDARKRFKVDKAIADTFPKEDPELGHKTRRKYSDESLEIAKEIIKMDKEGKLDEILKRHGPGEIDRYVKGDINFNDNELNDDSTACQRNMRTIEEKILLRLRMDGENATNSDEFKELLENYDFYKNKKKEIDDKLWDIQVKPITPVDCSKDGNR